MITDVTIDEIWHAQRNREHVRMGLPLPEGLLADDGQISIELGDQRLPLQSRTLSKWPDGSVRWAQLDFIADLDLRGPLSLQLYSDSVRPEPAETVNVEESGGRVVVNTGVLRAEIIEADVLRLKCAQVVAEARLSIREQTLATLDIGEPTVEVRAAGPLVAEVAVEAPCYAGSEHVMDARVVYRFFAGKSCVYATVSYLSREVDLNISSVEIRLVPEDETPVQMRAHSGMKRARVSETELLFNYAVDARSDPIWYEDSPDPCWVMWSGQAGAIAASIRNADHHFPTRMAVKSEEIELGLHPASEPPFHMYPWMGKTKEVMIELLPSSVTGYEVTLDSALFQRPVRPVCSPEYYARCRAFGDIFPTSRKYYGFEALVSTSLRERTVGCGAMHYGDEPNLGYTYSERGHGELVWTNGEYDTPHMLFVQYARTSNRSFFEAAEAGAFHWMDIDFLRDSPNPRWAGGLCCHEGDHRVAAYAGPSHEWAEGLIDYYHLTGNIEALKTAESIGDNVCRYIEDGEFDNVGTYALRELGWGLTAIAACLRATNKERYRQTGLRAIRILRRWADTFGGFREVWGYSEPGSDGEIMPLSMKRDAFVSLTLNGINRFYLASGETEARALFLDEVKAQLEWFNSPAGWAEQRETKVPNLEAFGYGFKYTRDPAYMRAGLQILEYVLANCFLRYYNMQKSVLDESHEHPATYRFQEVHAINSQILGLALAPMFSFMQVAEEAGTLEKLLTPP